MQCGTAEVTFRHSRQTHARVGLLSILPRAALPAALPEGWGCGMNRAPDVLGEPLAIAEVAKMLGCSAWTVRQRYLPLGLPHFRIGKTGKFTFYRNQVVQWILENQITERR
jgi:hypothetical protein